jgi:outer membrane protein assembly factor BamD (BamD/ComL family)
MVQGRSLNARVTKVRAPEETAREIDRLLTETRSYLRDSDFSSAGDRLEQLFQRWPENDDADKLLSKMASLEQAAFRAEVAPVLDGVKRGDLYGTLASLSRTFKTITDDILLLSEPPETTQRPNDALKQADIASIRSALSRGDLEEADARVKMAVLSFPDSSDVLSLDSEVAEQVRKDSQIKHWLAEAEEHLVKHNWKAAIRLFNSAHQMDPGRGAIRERIGEAFLAWAEELQHRDLRAALKLAESAVTFAPDSTKARKFRTELTDSYRSHAVSKAVANAKEHEAKGDFSMAERTIRSALEELPDQLTLVLYLKELDKIRRSRQYEQELRNVQDNVLTLTSERKYVEAKNALSQFLNKYPESTTALTLLEGVQRDQRQHENSEIADKALQDIAPLARGDLNALKRAIQTVKDALQKIGPEPRLANAIQELEDRHFDGERKLGDSLQRAHDDILHGRFKTASEYLQSAIDIDPENPQIAELRAELRRRRTATRRNTFNAYLTELWEAEKALIRGVWNGTSNAATSVYTAAWVKHRRITGLSIVVLVLALAGVMYYRHLRDLPKIVQLAIDSSPAGARVTIDGSARGVTPYTASWELAGEEMREVTIRLELEDYETFEELVKLSVDQRPAPLFHRLKRANVAGDIARRVELAKSALKAGALISPQDSSVIAYLSQMKSIDPGEEFLQAERVKLRREAIKPFKDALSRLKFPELGGDVELTMLRQFVEFIDPDDPIINALAQKSEERKSQQKQEIERSIKLDALLPSSPKSALDALKKFEAMFPSESGWVTEMWEEARRNVRTIAKGKCESEPAACDRFVRSVLEFFPGDAELLKIANRVNDGDATVLSPEDAKLAESMRLALSTRRFVYPPQNSAVYFANAILKSAPTYGPAVNARGTAREESDKEVAQLTGSSQETRALESLSEGQAVLSEFRRAQNLLEATLRFWPDDTSVRRLSNELRARISDINGLQEELKFEVVHNHSLTADCKGILVVSAYGVRYDTAGDHRFGRRLKDIKFPLEVQQDELELKTTDNRDTWKFKMDRSKDATGSITNVRNRIAQMRDNLIRIESKQK